MASFLLMVCICVNTFGCAGARTSTSLEPPGSTLSYGGETIEAGLGGYCWTSDQASSCVDAIGISLGGGELAVSSGASLSFEYEGDELDSLDVMAYEVGPEGSKSNRIEEGILVPPYQSVGKGDQPKARRSGTRASIATDLPAGEYVFDVRAGMPEGDASYGFHIFVEARGTASERPGARDRPV